MEGIHDRIRVILDNEKLSVAKFERSCGIVSNRISSALRRKSSITHEVIAKIHEAYPQYTPTWLITGSDPNQNQLLVADLLNVLQQHNLLSSRQD